MFANFRSIFMALETGGEVMRSCDARPEIAFDVRRDDGVETVTLAIADTPEVGLTQEQAKDLACGLARCADYGERAVVSGRGFHLALTSGSRTVCLTRVDHETKRITRSPELPAQRAKAIAGALVEAVSVP